MVFSINLTFLSYKTIPKNYEIGYKKRDVNVYSSYRYYVKLCQYMFAV